MIYARRSQKRQKDSQVKQLFALLGSACVKAARKHVDEIDPRSLVKIRIYDSSNGTQTQVFDVNKLIEQADVIYDDWIQAVRLGLNETYLVATVIMFAFDYVNFLFTTMVWKRSDNFAGAPLIFQRVKPGEKLGQPFNVQAFRSQFLKPIFQEDLLYLPIGLDNLEESQKITFSGWDLSTEEFEKLYEKDYVVNPDRKTLVEYCLSIKTNHILVVELDISDSENRQGKVSLFSLFDKNPIWEIGPNINGDSPQLLGIDETYVSVFWSPGNHLHVHSLKDGRLRLKLDVWNHFHFIYEVQISSNRLAISGIQRRLKTSNRDFIKTSKYDVIVFDLKTGDKILSLANDLKLNVGTLFLLKRERILILSHSEPKQIVSVKFWI